MANKPEITLTLTYEFKPFFGGYNYECMICHGVALMRDENKNCYICGRQECFDELKRIAYSIAAEIKEGFESSWEIKTENAQDISNTSKVKTQL